jgi:hypothetical protein
MFHREFGTDNRKKLKMENPCPILLKFNHRERQEL